MCITNDEVQMNKYRAKKAPFKAYRVHSRYRNNDDTINDYWETPYQMTRVDLQTDELRADVFQGPYRDRMTAQNGRYAYLDIKEAHALQGEEFVSGAAESMVVTVWVNPDDVIAVGEDVVVANKMFMDDKSWGDQRVAVGLTR